MPPAMLGVGPWGCGRTWSGLAPRLSVSGCGVGEALPGTFPVFPGTTLMAQTTVTKDQLGWLGDARSWEWAYQGGPQPH